MRKSRYIRYEENVGLGYVRVNRQTQFSNKKLSNRKGTARRAMPAVVIKHRLVTDAHTDILSTKPRHN